MIGADCFADSARTVISWRGENYYSNPVDRVALGEYTAPGCEPTYWHYAIRDRRLAEVYEGGRFGTEDEYCLLGWRDLPTILRDLRAVVNGICYDRRKRAA